MSKEAKRIAIIDLCRPSDIHQTQLQAAAIRKQQTYQPLVEGLSYYTEQGWVVHVFPWIVGIRGMIDSSHVQSVLKFLDIQQKHWQIAIEQTALASVRAFHFLHKVRFGGPLDRVQLDTDHSSAEADNVGTTVTKRKYQTASDHFGGDDSDSDSHEQVRLQKETRQLRKPRHAPFPIQVLASADLEALAPELPTRQTSNPVHDASPTRSLCRKRALHGLVERRYTVKRKIQTPAATWKRALEVQSDPSKTRGNCRPKRKRWNSSISTTLRSPDNLDYQPTKRHRQGIYRGEDKIWTRLNQLDPRKQRSSYTRFRHNAITSNAKQSF